MTNTMQVGQRIQTTFGTAGTIECIQLPMAMDYSAPTTYLVRSDAGGSWVAGVLHCLPAESIRGMA